MARLARLGQWVPLEDLPAQPVLLVSRVRQVPPEPQAWALLALPVFKARQVLLGVRLVQLVYKDLLA
jgi:hypothetical protein